MYKTVLKTHINYSEDYEPQHPLTNLSFNEIVDHINDLRVLYSGMDDLYYERDWLALPYGGQTTWYNLIGVKYV